MPTLVQSLCFVAPLVSGHLAHRLFRIHVISYHFGHFVPTFIFNKFCPFHTHFSHFVPSLVISYALYFLSSKLFFISTFFGCFVHTSFRTRSQFVPTLVILYPGRFVPILIVSTSTSFRTVLVILYPLLFSINFVHFIPTLVISYPVWSFRTRFIFYLQNYFSFLHFLVVSYTRHFVLEVNSYPL